MRGVSSPVGFAGMGVFDRSQNNKEVPILKSQRTIALIYAGHGDYLCRGIPPLSPQVPTSYEGEDLANLPALSSG